MCAYRGRYADELISNAAYIANPMKGILDADESVILTDSRLGRGLTVENNETNRRALRQIFFGKVGAFRGFVSGVILLEESLYQTTLEGKPFVQVFKEAGVLPGIKVDKGRVELARTNDDTFTHLLDGLGARCAKYYEAGARFAECDTVLKIGPTEPSQLVINEKANGLARFAIICQENGLVPILRPRFLVDGPPDVSKYADIGRRALAACYKALNDHKVLLEGTVRGFPHTDGVPAMVFLSGEEGEEEAILNHNAINRLQSKKPWSLSIFAAWGVVQDTHMAWSGKEENVKKAREAFLIRCKDNSEATLGIYREGASESRKRKRT